MPELRIVSQELWDRVKDLQAKQSARSQAVRAALHKNARTGAGPEYLFSGLLRCAVCGGNYIIADAYRYGCSININRGPHACGNAMRVPRKIVEDRLLEAIKRDLLSDDALALFEKETRRLIGAASAQPREARTRLQHG